MARIKWMDAVHIFIYLSNGNTPPAKAKDTSREETYN